MENSLSRIQNGEKTQASTACENAGNSHGRCQWCVGRESTSRLRWWFLATVEWARPVLSSGACQCNLECDRGQQRPPCILSLCCTVSILWPRSWVLPDGPPGHSATPLGRRFVEGRFVQHGASTIGASFVSLRAPLGKRGERGSSFVQSSHDMPHSPRLCGALHGDSACLRPVPMRQIIFTHMHTYVHTHTYIHLCRWSRNSM